MTHRLRPSLSTAAGDLSAIALQMTAAAAPLALKDIEAAPRR